MDRWPSVVRLNPAGVGCLNKILFVCLFIVFYKIVKLKVSKTLILPVFLYFFHPVALCHFDLGIMIIPKSKFTCFVKHIAL
jgi:hypothetical protein